MRPLLQLTRTVRGFSSGLLRRTYSSAAASTVNLQNARPFEEIPGPRGKYSLPLIGTFFHFKPFGDASIDDLPKFFDIIMDKYGPLVRARFGEWVVLVEDPDDIQTVFRNEGKYPHRMPFLLNEMFCEKYGIPKSLADMQGEEWHNFRNPLNSLLMRTKSAQHYLAVQNEVADDLMEQLKKPLSSKELNELFYRYACESISVVCFNKRLGYLDLDAENDNETLQILDDIATLLEEVSNSLKVPPIYIKYFPSKIKKRYFESGIRVYKKSLEYYRNAIDLVKQKQREGTLDVDRHDFMLSLMTSGKVSPEKMASIAFNLFVAGTDSTARTLQVVLYNLSRNPDKQQKLYEEVRSTMGESGPLTEQAISSMSYLLACLKESFRVTYPTTNGTQRYLPNDIVLKGYRIPAGTSIIMMNQRVVKDPTYFPDPDSYIPERWLRDENRKRKTNVPAYASLPFGFGKRMCIGRRFAEQEIYLALSKIVQKFQVSLPEDQVGTEWSYTPFTGPKEPLTFVFKERKQ